MEFRFCNQLRKFVKYINYISFACFIILNCHSGQSDRIKTYQPNHPAIYMNGRIDTADPTQPRLSGAGAYIKFTFKGIFCDMLLQDENLDNKHNYIAIELDGSYRGRMVLNAGQKVYRVADQLNDAEHALLLCKATEAQIGYIAFEGIRCREILPLESQPSRKIEFIGNSITCGMGVDESDKPCGSGEWYDQHNAYFAYGPLIANELNADWFLSSVSGIGITRNWNSPGPTMPEVYNSIYLNKDSNALWNFSRYIPDLVSVCLGTNDFSDGDGKTVRTELDSAQFVNDYTHFLKLIRRFYPEAQICCLSSPTLSGEKAIKLVRYLRAVIESMQSNVNDAKIHLFVFSRAYTNGCSWHPNKHDHELMAEELVLFYKSVMDW